MKATLNHNSSTFTLRGIDQQKLIEAYINGEHRKILIENTKTKKALIFTEPVKQVKVELTENYNNKSYILNSNSVKQVIHTTNQDLYEIFYKENKLIEITFDCFYCRVNFTRIPCGFPIIVNLYLDKYVFHVDEPYYCSFECVKAALCESKQDTSTIEENLNLLISLMYPETEIKRANNWKLHEKNHGPLTELEYRKTDSKFILLTSVIMIPLKRQYAEYR